MAKEIFHINAETVIINKYEGTQRKDLEAQVVIPAEVQTAGFTPGHEGRIERMKLPFTDSPGHERTNRKALASPGGTSGKTPAEEKGAHNRKPVSLAELGCIIGGQTGIALLSSYNSDYCTFNLLRPALTLIAGVGSLIAINRLAKGKPVDNRTKAIIEICVVAGLTIGLNGGKVFQGLSEVAFGTCIVWPRAYEKIEKIFMGCKKLFSPGNREEAACMEYAGRYAPKDAVAAMKELKAACGTVIRR